MTEWILCCFAFKGGRGINKQKLLVCIEGVSKNKSLGNQIFNTVMSVETLDLILSLGDRLDYLC